MDEGLLLDYGCFHMAGRSKSLFQLRTNFPKVVIALSGNNDIGTFVATRKLIILQLSVTDNYCQQYSYHSRCDGHETQSEVSARTTNGLSECRSGHTCELREVCIVHSFKVVQAKDGTLAIWQGVDEAQQLSYLLIGCRAVGIVVGHTFQFHEFHLRQRMGTTKSAQSVQGEISDQHHCKSLDVSDELLAQHPELQHRVLHDVLCLVAIIQIASGQCNQSRSQLWEDALQLFLLHIGNVRGTELRTCLTVKY